MYRTFSIRSPIRTWIVSPSTTRTTRPGRCGGVVASAAWTAVATTSSSGSDHLTARRMRRRCHVAAYGVNVSIREGRSSGLRGETPDDMTQALVLVGAEVGEAKGVGISLTPDRERQELELAAAVRRGEPNLHEAAGRARRL